MNHGMDLIKSMNARSRNARGMTLVELLVSLVILMIVLGAVYSILNLQQTKSSQVTRTT